MEAGEQVDGKIQKCAHGTYTFAFWKFYESGNRYQRNVYSETNDARIAQISILRTMSRKHIFDVRITRRKNVLYLEKTEIWK